MGKKKYLLHLSLLLSGVSAVLNILPFILVLYIVRSLLASVGSIDIALISQYAGLAFISAIAGLLAYFFALMSSHLTGFHVEVAMQKVGMEKIMSMPLGFFNQHASGKIRKIVNDGASTTHGFLAHQLPDIAGSIISPLILIGLILIVDWRMGLASLVPIILGFITMSFMMNKEGQKFQKLYYDSLEVMSSEAVEYVRGIPVVKTFGQTVFSFKRFHGSIINYKKMVLAYTLLWKRPMSFYTVIMQSAAFFILPMAILLIGRGNDLHMVLTDFIFYLLVSPVFTSLIMKSMHFRQNELIATQALDRLDNLLNYDEINYKDKTMALKDYSIEFKDVVFSYEKESKPAVDGISFKLEQGQTLALVGESGGGKTTIARLIARFWQVESGQILIGGVDIKDIPKKQLMDHISFVFQSTKLFKGSIRDNILFGNDIIHKGEVDRAVRYGQCKDIIDSLPQGLDTVIGSEGTYLSGGEQQRVALARAILKNSPIVLLDEATAFTDPENEHLIQKGLKELGRNKTTLIIAHRLTSVKDVDKILVVNHGKIIESGNHKQLIKLNGKYKEMWDEYQQSISWKITDYSHDYRGGQYA